MDQRKRELGRGNAENDIEQQAQHLAELMRSVELEREKVAFMAFLGDEVSRLIIPESEYKSPDFSSTMELEDRKKFFDFIENEFGKLAVLSLFKSVFSDFRSFYVGYVQQLGSHPIDEFDDAITLIGEILDGKELSEDERLILTVDLNTEYNRVRQIEYENRIANGEGDFMPQDSDSKYALGLLDSVGVILQYLDPVDSSLTRDIHPATAYESLANSFLRTHDLPSGNLLVNMPEDLKQAFEELSGYRYTSSEEEADTIDKLLLTRMKHHGHEWALKDVK